MKRIYENMKEKKRAEYLRNRQRYLQRAKGRYDRLKDEILPNKRAEYKMLREKLLEILGTKTCIVCGYSKNPLALCFDHINGGGREQREELGYFTFLKYYTSNPELARSELQILCAKCNLRKEKQRRRALRIGSAHSRHHLTYRLKRDTMLFNVLLNQCQHCWESDREVLVIDHINGDGAEDRRRFVHGIDQLMTYYYKRHDEAREKLQLLCANCNQIKMFLECYGVC